MRPSATGWRDSGPRPVRQPAALAAGRPPLPVGGSKQRTRYEWNPIFGKLIVAVIAVVVAWFAIARRRHHLARHDHRHLGRPRRQRSSPASGSRAVRRSTSCTTTRIPTWIRYGRAGSSRMANADGPSLRSRAENGVPGDRLHE